MSASAVSRPLREVAVFLAYLSGAVVFTYPLIRDLRRSVTDLADPLLDAWAFAWLAHQLPRDPLHLFDANRFYPEPGSLAFTDPMVGLALLVSPVQALFGEPVLTLNAALLGSIALSGYGAYRLVNHLTGSAAAGGVAGSVFAFNPYRLSHLAHVQLQAAGFLPLLYLSLRRYVEEGRALHAAGISLFLWLTCASSAYYGVFTWTLLGIAVPFELWRTSLWRKPRRAAGLGLALAIAALAYVPLASPFMKLEGEYGFHRPLERMQRASARPGDYLRTGSHLHASFGLRPPAPERTLFPGLLAVALSSIALLRRERGFLLYAVLGTLAAWASLGPSYGLYRLLHAVVPGLSGIRVPPRFSIYAFFAAAVLAGLGASWLLRRTRRAKRNMLAAALILFPLVESLAVPLPYTRVPAPPAAYAWLAAQPHPSPVVELPLPEARRSQMHRNAIYVYWSTAHFQPIANGYATVIPRSYVELSRELEGFPHSRGVAALRRFDIRFVLLHRDLYLRHRAEELEKAMDTQNGLRRVHRTRNETVYEVIPPES